MIQSDVIPHVVLPIDVKPAEKASSSKHPGVYVPALLISLCLKRIIATQLLVSESDTTEKLHQYSSHDAIHAFVDFLDMTIGAQLQRPLTYFQCMAAMKLKIGHAFIKLGLWLAYYPRKSS